MNTSLRVEILQDPEKNIQRNTYFIKDISGRFRLWLYQRCMVQTRE